MIAKKSLPSAGLGVAVLTALLASLLAAPAARPAIGPVSAQSADGLWTEPVNISRSGAADSPRIVSGPDGFVQVFWWDRFDGIMTAVRQDGVWAEPAAAPIIITEIVGEGERAEIVRTPVGPIPAIFGGTEYAHAFWSGEPDEDTGIQPFLHSRLALGATTWSEPRQVAETARTSRMVAAADGMLHLVYLRPRHTGRQPAGLYYQRSTNNGFSWSLPQPFYQTIYFRLLEAGDAYLWLTPDDQGRVYAGWDDARLGKTYLAVSGDSGETWSLPQVIEQPLSQAPGEQGARRARLVFTQEQPLLLWEGAADLGGCGFFQQRFTPPLTGTLPITQTVNLGLSEPLQVLEDLRGCPAAAFLQLPDGGDPLMVLTAEGLRAAAWNGEQWSEVKPLDLGFTHPETGRQVILGGLITAFVEDQLVALALGDGGDLWYLASAVDTWEWAFAPPPEWTGPVTVDLSAGHPGKPVAALDAEGRIHAVWSLAGSATGHGTTISYARLEPVDTAAEEELPPQWSRPAEILKSPDGRAEQPALATYQDQLFAAWTGGQGDRIYASKAYVRDAYAPGGWSQPQEVPMGGLTASSPSALIDAYGLLHLVYAAPLNDGRGIYYTVVDSEDMGLIGAAVRSWVDPVAVFNAQEAGWAMVDHPVLALDPAGTLHVAWVRGSSRGPYAPQGVYYARSTDAGMSWTSPREMVEGAYTWPLVAAPLAGQVHLLWSDVNGTAWTHRWSGDYGETWSYQQPVRGFRDVPGPAGMALDGVGGLYLAGLGSDPYDQPTIVLSTWRLDQERWEEWEPVPFGAVKGGAAGVALTLRGPEGRLDALFRATVPAEEGLRSGVVHAYRTVPAVEQAPEPLYTPVPTMTPLPTPTPTPTPTPRPQVEIRPPAEAPPIVGLGPITFPVIAVAGLGLALVFILVVLLTSSRGRRR